MIRSPWRPGWEGAGWERPVGEEETYAILYTNKHRVLGLESMRCGERDHCLDGAARKVSDREHGAHHGGLSVSLRGFRFYEVGASKDLRKEKGFRKIHVTVTSKMD